MRDGTWVVDTTGQKSDPDRFSLGVCLATYQLFQSVGDSFNQLTSSGILGKKPFKYPLFLPIPRAMTVSA